MFETLSASHSLFTRAQTFTGYCFFAYVPGLFFPCFVSFSVSAVVRSWFTGRVTLNAAAFCLRIPFYSLVNSSD